ncbi:MAG: helix-turn-helix domain-containing protein [Chloroflexi bacterium]|nr:helix-turn-helix domain-containing protein [Chloroflexota bacterium]
MTDLRTPTWTLGDRLRKSRMDAGFDQENMATHLGVTREAISKWEQDASQPRNLLRVVERWAELTKVPTGWLLGIEAKGALLSSPEPLVAA